jgi:glucokinase
MSKDYLAVNIGGTTCSVGTVQRDGTVTGSEAFPTTDRDATLGRLIELAGKMVSDSTVAVGISCGGPLDPRAGIVQSPPNLPGWDEVPIVRMVEEAVGKPVYLMNDANAGALAEWYFGTDCTCNSILFLTCGTGMGAGLILEGKLFEGPTHLAGEVGHMRLTADGPVGFGKAGSFEGWCSGNGFQQYAGLTVKDAAEALRAGEATMQEHFDTFGRRLGEGIAILIDLFNPERIVLGGIFLRCEDLLVPAMQKALDAECLPESLAACTIAPASGGEETGLLAAAAVARYNATDDPVDHLIRRQGRQGEGPDGDRHDGPWGRGPCGSG